MSTKDTTSPAHTPGPWILVDSAYPGIDADGQNIILNGDLGEYCGVRGESHNEAQANARLIAAAPDLLALAKTFHSSCEDRISILNEELSGDEEVDGDLQDQIGNWTSLKERCESVIAKAS